MRDQHLTGRFGNNVEQSPRGQRMPGQREYVAFDRIVRALALAKRLDGRRNEFRRQRKRRQRAIAAVGVATFEPTQQAS